MDNTTPFGRFNWDPSANDPNMNFINDMLNVFPIRPQIQNPFLNTSNDWQELLTNSFLQRNPYKKVTTDKAIEDIKKIKYETIFNQKECPITMMEFKEGEEISQLPCEHLFNTQAINRWLKDENYKCPVCRYEMDNKEVKKYDISGIDMTDPLSDLSGVRINTLLPNLNGNMFETHLINMVQNQIRSNYHTDRFSQMIEEIQDELDTSYDDELQQALWESMI